MLLRHCSLWGRQTSPSLKWRLLEASYIFAVSQGGSLYTNPNCFKPVLGNVCCSYLYQIISFFLLCPHFLFTILFLFLFPVTNSSPLLHFHPTGFYDCFETRGSLYFSSLLCLSSYCTCNLRASVSTFLYILLCSSSSVSSFFIIPLCFFLVSPDIAFQFHLLFLSKCSCFF